ncbi:protoplast regeneration and killer toxin resistance protein [Melanomma pulvis-pyrius CBS 109.77]|uniref:Protoplast regeneration and killer toxin resistance protein n=1 Tax=Melanomma pulvis-pyrius CBS 109.77 TaxID=1314802 RepID=A0A6A6WQP9_9PLEO|nr:protoplast regeneration and killer toxin resistance protein [Melanomma pulvis-pyrius CBS 109.77]
MAEAAPVAPNRALPPLPPDNIPNSRPKEEHDAGRASLSSTESRSQSLRRKPVAGAVRHQSIPSFNFAEHDDTVAGAQESRQSGSSLALSSIGHSRSPSRDDEDIGGDRDSANAIPVTRDIPIRQLNVSNSSYNARFSHAAEMEVMDLQDDSREQYQQQYYQEPTHPPPAVPGREILHSPSSGSQHSSRSDNSGPLNSFNFGPDVPLQVPRTTVPRPSSAYTLGSELNSRGHTPHLSVGGTPSPSGSPVSYGRQLSGNRRSPENRPSSYIDLLNLPYKEQIAPASGLGLGNNQLRHAVGQNASLLDSKKTLDMYRANVKKTQDSAVQYEFALFMVQVAREVVASEGAANNQELAPAELLREARQILQRLADRSYPFAQYYLGDGYASGLFNKDKPDYDRAFPLFVAASKHGHAESGYRAALCYEFGWGCRKDYAKAVQFYRAAASKNHPGAATRLGKACLTGDMGLQNRYREGLKWLKRATESADHQYNSAPYELGLLHETGYGDDIFKDEIYAVQLFTQAAELGHPQAALKLGEAYEHGLLRCPKDAALSVHYYNCAAQADIPEAMMNLCAWYMLGAEPVLEKDENEAYEWAKRAAEHGLPKAEYACGYFTETGIGCRRDPLEANVWYVKAAGHGDERARQRLAVIQAAASGQTAMPTTADKSRLKKGGKDGKDSKDGKDENCLVM